MILPGQYDAAHDEVVKAVAAERERCAKIAEAHPGACQQGCEAGEEIAAEIREGK